jgi:hypothetical protein
MGNGRKIGFLSAVFAVLLLMGCFAPLAVFAADDGVYLTATNTYYLNPDTGVTDDGGSKNAAIGEGMCRSVIYEKALVEIDGGRVYATVRVQLVSNMGAIKFTVQQKAGDPSGYSSVSPRIIAEDAGTDTADYRFEIPSVTSYIGCSTYVTPMGRDVKFYMNLSSGLTEGSGDFVVSVKPRADAAQPAVPAVETPAQTVAETTVPAQTETPAAETPAQSAENTPAAETSAARSETGASETTPAAETQNEPNAAALTGANADTDAAGESADVAGVPAHVQNTGGTEADGNTQNTEPATDSEAAPAAEAPENAESTGAGGGFPVIPVVVAVIILIAGAAVWLIRGKRSR